MVRSFGDDGKFTVRSVPEIFEKVAVLVARYRAKGLQFDGRTFSREVLVNALFLHFDGLSPELQRAALDDGMARLVEVLDDGTGPDAGRPSPAPVPIKSPRKRGH